MLEAGEDARFIARRLVILASEDIGEADPLALVVADAAARAVEFVGLPEAQLNLAQAVVHLACAPKSNRVTVALGRAQADVREGPRGDVPGHLRDAHYRSAASIGHGEGYVYPHDDPRAGSTRSTGRRRWPGTATTSRATVATRRRWPSDCAAWRHGRRPVRSADEADPAEPADARHRRDAGRPAPPDPGRQRGE